MTTTGNCANHDDTRKSIDLLFDKHNNHETRIDALEAGSAVRQQQIEDLCRRLDKLIDRLNTNTKYAITTMIALAAVFVPVFVWAVEKFTAVLLALK